VRGDWRTLVRQHVRQARQILKKVLVESPVFTPVTTADPHHYRFDGKVTFGKLVEGLTLPTAVASPNASAPSRNPEIVVGFAFDGALRLAA
jgi:hypothetical protein